MSDLQTSRDPGEVIFHFDVQRGSIPLSHFIESARAAEEIIASINEQVFDKKLKYEIRVRTPEDGSLIEVLDIWVVGGGALVWAILESDIGKAFVKGLTGKYPADLSEELGEKIRNSLIKLKARHSETNSDADEEEQSANERKLGRLVSTVLALMVIGFLTSDTANFKKIGISPDKFRAAYQGRNRFFKACLDNKEVQGVSFERAPNFTLARSDFPRQIVSMPDQPAPEPEKLTDLAFETVDIVVNSPNWKRDGRKWQAESAAHQDIAFSVEDEAFWFRVERRDRELQPGIRDNLRVQWAHPIGSGKPTNVKVLRVLSYNGRELAKPMTEQEMKAYEAKLHFVEPEAPDLFDERRSTNNDNKNNEGNA